jgi:hypothetical protein
MRSHHASAAGVMWREAGEVQQAPYHEMAKQDHERYERESAASKQAAGR